MIEFQMKPKEISRYTYLTEAEDRRKGLKQKIIIFIQGTEMSRGSSSVGLAGCVSCCKPLDTVFNSHRLKKIQGTKINNLHYVCHINNTSFSSY